MNNFEDDIVDALMDYNRQDTDIIMDRAAEEIKDLRQKLDYANSLLDKVKTIDGVISLQLDHLVLYNEVDKQHSFIPLSMALKDIHSSFSSVDALEMAMSQKGKA